MNILEGNRKKMLLLFLCLLLIFAGCSQKGQKGEETAEERTQETEIEKESEKLAEGYREIYEAAAEEGTLDTLETKQQILSCLEKEGYAAVDREDQLNMVNSDKMEAFCLDAQAGKQAEVVLLSLIEEGGFVRYDLTAEDGKIQVHLSTLGWKNREPKVYYHHAFTAHSWKYTDRGYFFLEEYQPSGYDSAPGQIGFRVKPLDETCRELNRKYVCPVGYEGNNLLITDWSEQDYTGVDFYDLYEDLYYEEYGRNVPYERGEGVEYQVPAEEIEDVLKDYFRISSEQIRANMVYDPQQQTYRYRPRGMNDGTLPYGPYPEVTGYEEQEDGTLKLYVEAVWERKMNDQVVSSELVVRLLADGSFQYVSNHVTSFDEALAFSWYEPRLTEEEWQYYYGDS